VSVDTREERLARRNWLIEAGYAIQRITDYDAWLQRFETGMPALPEQLIDRPWIQVRHVVSFEGECPIKGVS
jgi:hypothetical protein